MERSRKIRISEGEKVAGHRHYRNIGSRKGDMTLWLFIKINHQSQWF